MTPVRQASLFDSPATQGAARKRDRQTAKAAAESMTADVLNRQQREVLEVVAANAHGATAYEVATQTGYQQNVCARRLSDLDGFKFARRTSQGFAVVKHKTVEVFEARPGSTGRRCDVWRITDAGREWLYGVVDVAVAGGRL